MLILQDPQIAKRSSLSFALWGVTWYISQFPLMRILYFRPSPLNRLWRMERLRSFSNRLDAVISARIPDYTGTDAVYDERFLKWFRISTRPHFSTVLPLWGLYTRGNTIGYRSDIRKDVISADPGAFLSWFHGRLGNIYDWILSVFVRFYLTN